MTNPVTSPQGQAARVRRMASVACAAVCFAALLAVGAVQAQMAGHSGGMHGQGHAEGHGHGHGADGTGHDEVNMPGLRGDNVTPEETAEMAMMFRNFDTLSREVTELPDGIRTVTRSSDPHVMEALVNHVTTMIGRVQSGDDPKVFIQSPTLDIFFLRGGGIETDIDVTEAGIVVVQTSQDRDVVAALHTHAAEVSNMAARGMQAVHEMMMKRAGD